MNKMVEATVIGSYPVQMQPDRMMNAYHRGILPSWHPYIDQAVSSMVSAGVDMVSDGQTRDPFIHIFMRGFEGCRIRNRPEVISPIDLYESITGKDLSYVSTIIPKKKKILGLIVGPCTMSESVVDLYYHDKKELAFVFASVLQKEIKYIEPYVDMISIDEPFFANTLPEYGKELINMMIQDISIPTRLHVCGDVSPIVGELVDFSVDILSHEFKAKPGLFDIFQEYTSSRGICLGSVRSDKIYVESVDCIIRHIEKGREVFGSHIAQIAPDCGLRMLPEKSAYEKLQNLVIAKRKVYG